MVLRLVLPPLTVLLAAWVQHRVGPRLSGRLIGLPLTSGPFLVLVLLQHGASAMTVSARGVVAGQLMVVAFAATYAAAASGRRPLAALLGAIGVTVATGAVVPALLPWPAAPVAAGLAVGLALATWPRVPGGDVSPGGRTSAAELAGRATLTGLLVAGLAALTPVIGAGSAGLLASVPLVIAVTGPALRRRCGAGACRVLLRGTVTAVPGTAAFATVLALAVEPFGGPVAFGAALVALVAVGGLVATLERRPST